MSSTQFTSTVVNLAGFHFTLDGNSKVTAGGGSFDTPIVNSFSLRHVLDCPQATETCKSTCYVHGLKQHKPDLWWAYERNAKELRRMLADDLGIQTACASQMAEWINENAPEGFRWHVSGDIISVAHANWIADVADQCSPAFNWIYTRSFEHLTRSYLVDVGAEGSIAINLSADKDNYKAVRRLRKLPRYRACRICYMTLDGVIPDDLPDGSVIFPSYELRGDKSWWGSLSSHSQKMVCPPDFFGQSQSLRCGPCTKCLRPEYL